MLEEKCGEVHGLKAVKASLHRNFYPEHRPLYFCKTLSKVHRCPGFSQSMYGCTYAMVHAVQCPITPISQK